MPAESSGSGVGVHVAVFGRHPGWPGSIEDIGLTCEELTRAKRQLYLLGLGAQADAGAWESVSPEARCLGYPSVMLWRLGSKMVVGRLWSTRAGKGGAPMFACAVAEGMPHAWTVDAAGALLKDVEAKAAQTSSPELVRLSVGEARRTLEDRALIASATKDAKGAGVTELLDHTELGPGREGMLRVLGALEQTRSGDPGKTVNLRVPRCLADAGRAAHAWIEVIAGEVPAGTPILALADPERAWVDLVVGEPRGTNLVCARVNEKAMPLSTKEGQPPRDVAGAKRRLEVLREAVPVQAGAGGKRRVSPLIPVGVIGLILAGWWLMRGGSATAPAVPADGSGPGARSVAPIAEDPAGPGEGTVQAAVAQASETVERLKADAAGEGREFDGSLADKIRQVERRLDAMTPTQNPVERAAQRRELAELHEAMEGVRAVAQERLDDSRVRLSAMLDDRSRRPAQTSDGARRVWTSQVRAIDPNQGWAAAKARLAELEPALARAEAGVASATRIQTEDLPEVVRGPLTRVIGRGVEDWMGQAAQGAADGKGIEGPVSRARAWTAEVEAVLAQGVRLDAGMRGAYMPDEPVGNGASLLGSLAAMQGMEIPAGIGEAMMPLIQQVNVYVQIQESKDASGLARMVRAGATTEDELARAHGIVAYQRLTSLDWIKGEAEIASLPGLREAALRAAMQVQPERRVTLGSRLRRSSVHMVRKYLEGCSDGAAQAGMFGVMDRLEFTPEDVQAFPGWVRFNREHWRLEDSLGRHAGLDPSARLGAMTRESEAFIDRVHEIDGSREACDRVRESLDPWASLDLASLGPARAGWRLVNVSRDAGDVEYAKVCAGVPEQRVVFRRLPREKDEPTVTYLAANETSVGVFMASLAEVEAIESFDAAISASYLRGGSDPRRGVRAWDWGRREREYVVPTDPDSDPPSRGWMRQRPGMEGRSYVPTGAAAPAPGWDFPMQYVSPQAALASARLMGCRLPTAEEWRRAAARPGLANLRDRSWLVVMDHLKTQEGYQPEWPTSGVFYARGDVQPLPGEDVVVLTDATDGWAWLAPVWVEGERFAHIVGNVAEYVFEDREGMEALAEPTPGAAEALLGGMERLGVIGGSALSSWAKAMEARAVEPSEAAEGYADVGYRLAFSVDKSRVSATRALGRIEEAVRGVRSMRRPGEQPEREGR